jgi:hypothetical protein
MKDPFFDPSTEERELHFEIGSQEELDRLMRLFILTEPGIDKHVGSQVCLFAGAEGRDPRLEDRQAYCSKRLKRLAEIALSENRPMGWSFETTMAPISDEAVMTGILQASPGGSAKFSNRPLPARRWRLAVSFASISNLAAMIRRSSM